MKVNGYAMPEIHGRVICDIGMNQYEQRLLKEYTSDRGLAQAVKDHRAEIELEYVQAYAIVFDYRRDPDYFDHEEAVAARKDKLAGEALRRLRAGESFEKVAKEVSEDEVSAPDGGALGCVRMSILGPDVGRVFSALSPGEYSELVKTSWACYIVMRKKLTDDDILSVVRDQAKYYVSDQVSREFWRARRRRFNVLPLEKMLPGVDRYECVWVIVAQLTRVVYSADEKGMSAMMARPCRSV